MGSNDCFACRKCRNHRIEEPYGWVYDCADGLSTDGITIADCPNADPRVGFQIGGYYTHMWFEQDGKDCLEWCIASDGEFPTQDGTKGMELHICDFYQLKAWLMFWETELVKRGWIAPDTTQAR